MDAADRSSSSSPGHGRAAESKDVLGDERKTPSPGRRKYRRHGGRGLRRRSSRSLGQAGEAGRVRFPPRASSGGSPTPED